MKKLIPLSLICLLLVGVSNLQAQTEENPFGFNFHIGTQSYNGDLGNELLEWSGSDFTYGIGLAFYLSPAFDLALNASIMQLDRTNGPNQSELWKRNTSFETSVFSLNLLLHWKFIQDTRLNPYLAAGLGLDFAQFTKRQKQSGTFFAIPFGAGINYTLDDDLALNFQMIYNRTFNDKIDGYPLSASETLPGEGAHNNNDGADHDDFMTTTVGLVYSFGGGEEEISMEERLLQQTTENLEDIEGYVDEVEDKLDRLIELNEESLNALEQLQEAHDMSEAQMSELRGKFVRIINNIQFAFDESYIIEPAMDELNSLAHVMKKYPNLNILIEAYADERGSVEYNNDLAQHRAQSVKDYLTGQGVNSARIITDVYGETEALMEGDTEADQPTVWAQNRAVQITLSYNGGM